MFKQLALVALAAFADASSYYGRGYGHGYGAGLGVGAGTVSKAGEFGPQAKSAYPAYANKKYGRGHK
jgi:hypothetical protein